MEKLPRISSQGLKINKWATNKTTCLGKTPSPNVGRTLQRSRSTYYSVHPLILSPTQICPKHVLVSTTMRPPEVLGPLGTCAFPFGSDWSRTYIYLGVSKWGWALFPQKKTCQISSEISLGLTWLSRFGRDMRGMNIPTQFKYGIQRNLHAPQRTSKLNIFGGFPD